MYTLCKHIMCWSYNVGLRECEYKSAKNISSNKKYFNPNLAVCVCKHHTNLLMENILTAKIQRWEFTTKRTRNFNKACWRCRLYIEAELRMYKSRVSSIFYVVSLDPLPSPVSQWRLAVHMYTCYYTERRKTHKWDPHLWLTDTDPGAPDPAIFVSELQDSN